MKKYVSRKVINAAPMKLGAFYRDIKKEKTTVGMTESNRDGYYVRYPNNFETWLPKDAFEAEYRELGGEDGGNKCRN